MFTERKTRCPFSKTVLEQEKDLFNCLGTTDVYHCLLDERNRSGEICHQPIWVPKEFCPQYNTGAKEINIVPCNISMGCPDVPFRSNEVYKYSVCLNKTNTNYGGGIPEGQKRSSVSPWIIVAVAFAVILAVVCCIMCYIIRRKKKKNQEELELEPLCVENEIPLSCKKAIDYLKGNVFSPNTFYERAIGVLDVHHCITIIGPPGSGKTLTAVQLAYRKYEKSGLSKMYFCQTVEEILDTANKNKGVCIIVDDWIDKYVYYPSELDNAIDLLSSVYNEFVRSGKVHLILTAQEDKWDRISGSFKNCLLFQENSLLQIRLTKKEKQDMILSHFKHFNIKECSRQKQNKSEENCADYLTKLKNEEWFSFPVIIDLICTNERLGRKQQLILKNGFSDVFLAFFDNWLHNDDINERNSFCILVFAAFLGGKVSHRNFKSLLTGPLFEKVCNKFKCDLNAGNGDEVIYKRLRDQEIDLPHQEIDHEILFRENRRLRSCLYQTISGQNDTMFIFQHSSLFRFVLSYLKDKEEVFFIENVCIEVLIKQCWIEEGLIEKFRADQACSPLKQPVGSVRLSTSVLKLLAERIYHEKEQGYHIPKWDDHIFMRHRTFKEMWNKIDLAKSSCSIDK